MTHLRKSMLEELQRRNMSKITTRIYLRAVEEFAQFFKTPPDRREFLERCHAVSLHCETWCHQASTLHRLKWSMFLYDATLLTAIQAAPQSISDVLQTLQTIDTTCVDADGLKWFNRLYLEVTQAVEARVAAGGFTDSAWLAQLDVEFARLYFSALKSSLSGEATPACWQVLFDSRNQGAIARIQFALAGINAHINHDLSEAIVATCQITNTTPDSRGAHFSDYTSLNSTLGSLIESAKLTLNVRLPGEALPPISHLEDTLATWNVSAARESAWQNAERLWQLRVTPLITASFMDMLDGLTTVISKALLVPVP